MTEPMQNGTGSAFFKRWTDKWNEGDWECRILLDEHFLRQSNKWHQQNPGVVPKQHLSRVIPPSLYKITFGTDIYNDVVAYYNWHENEVFGVEIYNKDIAQAQRTFFEMLWQQSAAPAHDLGRSKE
jgi:hypothetical protein